MNHLYNLFDTMSGIFTERENSRLNNILNRHRGNGRNTNQSPIRVTRQQQRHPSQQQQQQQQQQRHPSQQQQQQQQQQRHPSQQQQQQQQQQRHPSQQQQVNSTNPPNMEDTPGPKAVESFAPGGDLYSNFHSLPSLSVKSMGLGIDGKPLPKSNVTLKD
jgi:hypothetical protein